MLKKQAQKQPQNKDIEKLLIPRLMILGGFLILLAFGFLNYAIFASAYPKQMLFLEVTAGPHMIDVSDGDSPMVPSKERLNFFGVAVVFAVVGTLCILAALHKKRILSKK